MLLSACAPPGPKALLDGKRFLEQGKYAEAIEKFKTATVLLATNAPAADTAQAWNDLGVAYHHAGQVAAAENAYQRAHALNSELIEVHYNLGCLWLEQNRFENARGEFTTYTLRRSTDPDGFIKLGTAELRASETGTVSARNKSLNASENSFKEALKLSPQNPEAFNGLGLVRLYRNQPAEAAQLFNSALKQQPAFAPALLNLAVVSQSYLNQPQVAVEKYRAYLALKPTPPKAEAVRQALRQLEQASVPPARPAGGPAPAGPAPSGGTTRPGAAAAASPAEEGKLAEEPPVKSQELPPNPTTSQASTAASGSSGAAATVAETNPPKRSLLQRLFGHSETPAAQPSAAAVTNAAVASGGNHAASEEDLPPLPAPAGSRYTYRTPVKPVAGDRHESDKAVARGGQALAAYHWSEAMQDFRTAAQIDPTSYTAFYDLSLAAAQYGDLRTALTAAESAVDLDPVNEDGRYNLALALSRANYCADAVNELEKLLSYAPNDAKAHLALANLYAQQFHQPAKARPHYQRALELDPHSKQADGIRYWLVQNK